MSKKVKIYVEGGGNLARPKRKCRQAFSSFFKRAGFKDRMPRIVACGSRNNAYDDFCTANTRFFVESSGDNE